MAGLPVLDFLRTEDQLERELMLKIAQRVIQLKQDLDKNRAVLIANAVGKMLSGK